MPQAKVFVIPNGVNLEKFYPEVKKEARKRMGWPQDKRIVLFVSNPARPEKNFRLAKQAVDKVGKQDVELKVLYGKAQEEVRTALNAADVLVLTSYHEGSPNIIKEAMACSCPIVSTDVGDVREVFGDTKGCFIGGYEPEDFEGQLKKALTFASDAGRTKGRERIMELGLDEESIAKRIVEVYEGVLGKAE